MAKGKRRATEAGTKARRETETVPFRCQWFRTGIIRSPYEFIGINIRLSKNKSNPDPAGNLETDGISHVLCSRYGLD